MVETPKVSHKKKGEREKEKERQEKELADKMEKEYTDSQIAKGRPTIPREALKRTTANNWIHVVCAVWTPETKFEDAKSLDLVEGVPQVQKARWDQVCKLCKSNNGGACVACHHCHANFHIGCAHTAGFTFGFDITPVKGSRRDGANIVTFGNETGIATAAIWCKDHNPKNIVHIPSEIVDDSGTSALQRYVINFKQADLTLTGTTRKANLLDESAKNIATNGAVQPVNRRASTTTTATSAGRGGRASNAGMDGAHDKTMDKVESPTAIAGHERRCDRCRIDTSPRWFAIKDDRRDNHGAMNGVHHDNSGDTRMVNGIVESGNHYAQEQRYLCQKCHWKRVNKAEDPPERELSRERASLPRSPRNASPKAPNIPAFYHNSTLDSGSGHFNRWLGRPGDPFQRPGAMTGPPPPHPGEPARPSPQHAPPHGVFHTNPQPPSQHQQGPPPPGPGFQHLTNPPPPNRTPFSHPPTSHGHVPPPLQLTQGLPLGAAGGIPNGLPSPHHQQHMLAHVQPPLHSPTHPPPMVSRQSGSPHFPPSHVGSYAHGSPPPPTAGTTSSGGWRPSTPRDAPENSIARAEAERREREGVLGGGASAASASPSLRNLLS